MSIYILEAEIVFGVLYRKGVIRKKGGTLGSCDQWGFCLDKSQKNPRVRKIRVRNSGAGNGCANFMGAWNFWVLSAGKPHKIPRFGGGILGLGGGEVPILFS